jgi:hypothetical protein
MTKKVLRAGKIISDYCKCGHLKILHQTTKKLIKCTIEGCNCNNYY